MNIHTSHYHMDNQVKVYFIIAVLAGRHITRKPSPEKRTVELITIDSDSDMDETAFSAPAAELQRQ